MSSLNVNDAIERLMDFYGVASNYELADKLKMQPSSISSWKTKNSISAVKKKCRELGIYKDIFGDIASNSVNNFQNSKNVVGQDFSNKSKASHSQNIQNVQIDENVLKLLDTLYSFASKNNKVNDLVEDLSKLLPKYL